MAKQSKSSKKPPDGVLFVTARAGNSLSSEPWLKDLNSLRLKDGEAISDLRVVVSVAKRLPQGDDDIESPEWGAWGNTLRQINFWLPTPQDKKRLAQVLLYCWRASLESKSLTIKDAIAELARVAESQGWVKPSDVTRKPKIGRPRGSFSKKTTVKYESVFKTLKAEMPQLGNGALLDKVVDQCGGDRMNSYRRAHLKTKVKKALQRRELFPISRRSPAGK